MFLEVVGPLELSSIYSSFYNPFNNTKIFEQCVFWRTQITVWNYLRQWTYVSTSVVVL